MSTLPCSGAMNCGNSDRYITAIFGLRRLVMKPIANSFLGLSGARLRSWNGERPPGLTVCQASHNR